MPDLSLGSQAESGWPERQAVLGSLENGSAAPATLFLRTFAASELPGRIAPPKWNLVGQSGDRLDRRGWVQQPNMVDARERSAVMVARVSVSRSLCTFHSFLFKAIMLYHRTLCATVSKTAR
jgi:hypothetical protein